MQEVKIHCQACRTSVAVFEGMDVDDSLMKVGCYDRGMLGVAVANVPLEDGRHALSDEQRSRRRVCRATDRNGNVAILACGIRITATEHERMNFAKRPLRQSVRIACEIFDVAQRFDVIDRLEMISERFTADRETLLDDERRLTEGKRVSLERVRVVDCRDLVAFEHPPKPDELIARERTQVRQTPLKCIGPLESHPLEYRRSRAPPRVLSREVAFAAHGVWFALREAQAMDPLIITVAAVGAEVMPDQNPHLPVTPEQLGETAARCEAAGAAMIHVHCRNDDGTNTSDVARFEAAYAAIRARSNLIVQFTTGGAIGMSAAERAAPLRLRPEMATLTCGTVNFGDDVFVNDLPLMRDILAQMHEHGVRPELEIFDAGHLTNAKRLADQGVLALPQHVDFVLGVPGALDASVRNLSFLVDALPPGCSWSVAGIGRAQLALGAVAVAMGGHVRVGLEDNLYYAKGRLARNDELVARIARVANELGRPVATPAQAREILGLGALALA